MIICNNRLMSGWTLPLLAFIGLYGPLQITFAQTTPTSTRFLLSQSTLNTGGASALSSSFVLDGSIAQPATVGQTVSSSFMLQSGFWNSVSVEPVLSVEGIGSGRGTISGAGITCTVDAGLVSGDCAEKVSQNTTSQLVATADAGNQFDGWSGCDSTSSTTFPEDTCQITLITSRTISAGFTLLGTISGRVWRDIDGNGTQDPAEPGLEGIAVTLDDGAGLSLTTTTVGNGLYDFADVPPGSYGVTIDTLTLPPGMFLSFDADGIATPHFTVLSLTDGENRSDIDFGYQPLIDLTITKDDLQDPLPDLASLMYNITVHNLGPAVATDVTVTEILPTATTLIATSGCAEDPNGAPICTLGELDIGATASFTVELAVDPEAPDLISNTAMATAIEVDTAFYNNTAVENTVFDDSSPQITSVASDAGSDAAPLTDCDTVNRATVQRLAVTFNEAMFDPDGDNKPGDVTNPASWRLLAEGDNLHLDTTSCGAVTADDKAIAVNLVIWDGTATAILELGSSLKSQRYRLLACGSGSGFLRDQAGNVLDGNGDLTAGGDFVLDFRADPDNRFADGHFDCDLGIWEFDSMAAVNITHSPNGVDGSPDSGSAMVNGLTSSASSVLSQCTPLEASADYSFDASLRISEETVDLDTQLSCLFFDTANCTGNNLGTPPVSTFPVRDTASGWIELQGVVTPPAGTVSALCSVSLVTSKDGPFVWVDRVRLQPSTKIFFDQFEGNQ